MFKYVYPLKGGTKLNHVLKGQKNTHDGCRADVMPTNSKPTQVKEEDWHRADVISALHKRGWSIAALARAHDLGESTVRSALDKPYPKSERLIAEAIGVAPEAIWPKRYAARNFTPTLRSC